MTNTMGFDVQFFQLRGSDVAKRDDFLAWKEIEERVKYRQTGGLLRLVGHPIAQQTATRIK